MSEEFLQNTDIQLEQNLRPAFLKDYIGQGNIKQNLNIALSAAKKRNDALDHMLLFGPPGLGKTTLANIVAQEAGVAIKITSGPALDKQGDVAAILSNLEENDVLFIDEIHRLKPVIEEVLYTAMEDFCIDIVIGKGPSARIMRLNLPKFTLVGATTKASMISAPLRDRFGVHFVFEFYTEEELTEIILRSAAILEANISREAAIHLAKSCRGTPRIANQLLKRVRDFAEVLEETEISEQIVINTLNAIGIDSTGLDNRDRRLLSTLIDKFKGGPVGLNTLAAALSEEESTIEDIYEPFLIQCGFLERTSRGRIVTDRAYEHLGISGY